MRKYLLCFLLLLAGISHAKTLQGTAKIIDGDGLYIGGSEVRLDGIDAPEYRQPCKLPSGAKFYPGREATKWLESVTANKVVSCKLKYTDKYGREVAVCYVDGEDINRALVRRGLAFANRFYSENYVADEEEAAFEGVGIWRGKCESPYEWRRKNKR